MKSIKLPASVKTLIKLPKKRKSVRERYPGEYFKDVYLSEKAHAGVELVASAKGISIKAATDLLVLAGVSKVMGDLVLEHI